MSNRESVNLTDIMHNEGILRIADIGSGQFSVWLRGGRCGTGRTVGEALERAKAQLAVAA
jgi:hypothetical protein